MKDQSNRNCSIMLPKCVVLLISCELTKLFHLIESLPLNTLQSTCEKQFGTDTFKVEKIYQNDTFVCNTTTNGFDTLAYLSLSAHAHATCTAAFLIFTLPLGSKKRRLQCGSGVVLRKRVRHCASAIQAISFGSHGTTEVVAQNGPTRLPARSNRN